VIYYLNSLMIGSAPLEKKSQAAKGLIS